MAGDDESWFTSYGAFVTALGVAAAGFPSLASWTTALPLNSFHRTADGDWTGFLVGIQPQAILLASGFFNMVALAGVVTSDWVRKNKRKLGKLAFLTFFLGATSSWVFYSRSDAAQTKLVAAARAAEASPDAAAGGSGPPRANVVRDRAVAAAGHTPMTDSLIGLPYCALFALWTVSLAFFFEKYRSFEKERPSRQAAKPAQEPAAASVPPGQERPQA
jgi:hypothetical protein